MCFYPTSKIGNVTGLDRTLWYTPSPIPKTCGRQLRSMPGKAKQTVKKKNRGQSQSNLMLKKIRAIIVAVRFKLLYTNKNKMLSCWMIRNKRPSCKIFEFPLHDYISCSESSNMSPLTHHSPIFCKIACSRIGAHRFVEKLGAGIILYPIFTKSRCLLNV